MKKLFLAAMFVTTAAAVQASPQTVTLDVPGMTCAACAASIAWLNAYRHRSMRS